MRARHSQIEEASFDPPEDAGRTSCVTVERSPLVAQPFLVAAHVTSVSSQP
jgi:hypothetical protein